MTEETAFTTRGSKPLGSLYYAGVAGAGTSRSAAHVEATVRRFQEEQGGAAPDFILACGFAGGLDERLSPGSLIIADTVTDTITHQAYLADSHLLAAAESVRLSGVVIQRGALATTDRVLIHAGEKRAFAEQTDANAVDMESAGVARVAAGYKIPCLAVRVVTDGVNDDLPLDFNALSDQDGNISRRRILLETALHPWKIPALVRLGQRSSLAARNLSNFLEQFLNRLPE